jgi:hypothetical protein
LESWILIGTFNNILKNRGVIEYMNKEQEIHDYSCPHKVNYIAKDLGLNPVGISTKSDKKYMIYDDKGHVKHFGQMYYQDWTKTRDRAKLNAFMYRNRKWYKAPKYSPAYLSAHLLWNPDY